MADYTTLLVLLSMAATARCSWISGGAPPPVSIGDELLDVPSPDTKGKHEVALVPSGDFIIQGKHEVVSGPSGDFIIQGKHDGEFIIQGKSSIVNAPADGGRDLIIQKKESAPANGQTSFIVQGKVYCDPCRLQFPTKISYPLPNTKIFLLCHNEESNEETYRLEGTSNEKGKYTFNAVGDHGDEVCQVTVSESPDPKCPEPMEDENHVRVSLTNKHGSKGKARIANPLGFMATDADPRCKEVLDELGFTGI